MGVYSVQQGVMLVYGPTNNEVRQMADIIPIDGKAGKKGKPKKARTDMRPADKLTSKQLAFANAMIKPDNLGRSKVYRSIYSAAQMSNRAVYTEAHRLMLHPQIALHIKAGQDKITASACLDGLSIRSKIKNALLDWSGVLDPNNPNVMDGESQRIAAAVQLGKMSDVRAFTDVVETTNVEVEPDQLQAELEQALKQAIGKV